VIQIFLSRLFFLNLFIRGFMTQLLTSIWSMLKFPVKKEELPKFICTGIMLMLTIYIYSILRNTKDTLLLSHLGAELISTTKLWSVLPSAVIFMLVYTKLANVASRTTLYNCLIWFFISFFVIFNFLLYPNLDHLMINMDGAIQQMPYMRYLLQMIAGWPIVLFYVLSELWGSVMMALMFWQLANQITAISESKRFYPLFLLIGQAGLLISGAFSMYYADTGNSDPEVAKQLWHNFLNVMTITLLISGAALSACLSILGKIIGKDSINDVTKGSCKKTKVRLGFTESLKYILSSKYIGLITMLILCYGISINLVEGIWKASVIVDFAGNKGAIQSFFGSVQMWTAAAGVIGMYGGAHLLSSMRWKTGALLTPIMIAITGVLFFMFIIFRESGMISPIIMALGTTPLYLAVMFGGAQNVLSKSTKYAFFDPTKEMSYIPLDEELKSKGKAAADVIGGRLGKSAGAAIQWGMLQIGFMFNPDISLINLATYFFIIFGIILIVWFLSANSLDKEFYKKIEENKACGAEDNAAAEANATAKTA
jgi:ATP:ADP antiporter, AAA family